MTRCISTRPNLFRSRFLLSSFIGPLFFTFSCSHCVRFSRKWATAWLGHSPHYISKHPLIFAPSFSASSMVRFARLLRNYRFLSTFNASFRTSLFGMPVKPLIGLHVGFFFLLTYVPIALSLFSNSPLLLSLSIIAIVRCPSQSLLAVIPLSNRCFCHPIHTFMIPSCCSVVVNPNMSVYI